MRRREFLKNTIYLPAAGITVAYLVVAGCSSDDSTTTSASGGSSTPGSSPSGTCTTSQAQIGANHGHTISPPIASEILGGVAIDLILTTVGHTHTVSLTAADLDTISTCGSVTKTSTLTGHTHQVTFTGV